MSLTNTFPGWLMQRCPLPQRTSLSVGVHDGWGNDMLSMSMSLKVGRCFWRLTVHVFWRLKLSTFYEDVIHALKFWRLWILTGLIKFWQVWSKGSIKFWRVRFLPVLISAQRWGITKNWCVEPATAKLASNVEKRKLCLVGHGERQVM